MSNSKVILALLGGAAAGIVLGVLFAPDKGSNLRKNLSASAKEFADKILSKAEEMVEEETQAHSRRSRERTV
jgi:gas vesicle protein